MDWIAAVSPDKKIRYAAVALSHEGAILGIGYNHPPEGYHCEQCPRVLDTSIKSGTQLEKCFAIHAEQAALADAYEQGQLAARIEEPVSPAHMMFVVGYQVDTPTPILLDHPGFYCSFCARVMYAFGIKEVAVVTRDGAYALTIQEALKDSFDVATGIRHA